MALYGVDGHDCACFRRRALRLENQTFGERKSIYRNIIFAKKSRNLYLYSRLAKFCSLGQLFAGVNVRILSSFESFFELIQLVSRERGPGASLLPFELNSRLGLEVWIFSVRVNHKLLIFNWKKSGCQVFLGFLRVASPKKHIKCSRSIYSLSGLQGQELPSQISYFKKLYSCF